MKRILFILTLFFILINTSFAASPYVSKDFSIQMSDGFVINGTLQYPNVKGQKEYSTVILLHSLGYNSSWWGSLPKDLLDSGLAVVTVDMRGHGKSIYNGKLVRTSWTGLTNSAFAKYPDDMLKVIEYIKTENPKKTFFDNYAFVGADIGASTAVIASSKLNPEPKTIVLLSPVVKSKSLCIPVKLANLDNVDILSISGAEDKSSKMAEAYLKRFAQNEFSTYESEAHSTGMLMLKNDDKLSLIITKWICQYLK